ncbi:MAG: PAS domain S-box protein, partial [Gemmatimonadetes bacterium]|nr:PAS domain S-box protein [Gemmatimonadota bacterium]NIU29668.1 PAS domain S-box protein [Gemmatimonadota bacterium]NIV60077.1 PAS domain S-box protein [Gemmatimonadota bacterium]NIW62735.1 PAS domain S-box protein [Gemmatimonadota bacterium]NIX41845.1 PAS domain S-box protein [Gemmatimonadota bacterium]
VFNASPDGVAVVDREGIIRAVNPKVEQMFGYEVDELLGQRVEVLLPEQARAAHEGHREGFVRDPHDRPMGIGLDLRAVRSDGTEFPVEVSLSPWRRGDDDLRIICSIRDVSAYRRLQTFSEGALRA